MDSGSLSIFFSIVEERIFGHLLAFLVQSTADLYHTWRNDWRQQDNASTVFCDRSDGHPYPVPINPKTRIQIPDHFCFKFWRWFALSGCSCCYCCCCYLKTSKGSSFNGFIMRKFTTVILFCWNNTHFTNNTVGRHWHTCPSLTHSLTGTLDRPRVVTPFKTCGHVRSSRRRRRWGQCRPRSAASTFGSVVHAGASTPAWCAWPPFFKPCFGF